MRQRSVKWWLFLMLLCVGLFEGLPSAVAGGAAPGLSDCQQHGGPLACIKPLLQGTTVDIPPSLPVNQIANYLCEEMGEPGHVINDDDQWNYMIVQTPKTGPVDPFPPGWTGALIDCSGFVADYDPNYNYPALHNPASCPTGYAWTIDGDLYTPHLCVPGAAAIRKDATQKGAIGACMGDPCQPGTGNQILNEVDIPAPGPSALSVTRTYNSDPLLPTGGHWLFNQTYTVHYMAFNDQGGAQAQILVNRPDGRAETYQKEGTQWVPDPAAVDQLLPQTTTAAVFLRTTDNVVERYNVGPSPGGGVTNMLLASRTDANNRNTTYTYDSSYRLTKVTDWQNRSLTFAYSGTSIVPSSVKDQLGNTVSYTYDPQGRLTTVTYPTLNANGTNATRQYLYEDPNNPSSLTGKIDENGNRVLTVTYDTQGRTLTSVGANGVDATSVSYAGPLTTNVQDIPNAATGGVDVVTTYNPPPAATITDPLGTSRTLAFSATPSGVQDTSATAPCVRGCSLQTQSKSYDANGNIAGANDFLGNSTTAIYDLSTNLPLSITEASNAAAQTRTTTYTWDPTFHLPLTMVEPATLNGATGTRTTTWAYSGTGQLLSQSVSTTAGGVTTPVRTVTYTYGSTTTSGNAQVLLNVKGPRTDVDQTTAFTYSPYTTTTNQGNDLNKVTDALGHVWTINAYWGTQYTTTSLVRSITDPNGLTTQMAYDALNRITSVQRGSSTTHWETTGITYSPSGQVATVTAPDGSVSTMRYDPNDRLVGVDLTDENGHAQGSANFTLDAIGNTTGRTLANPDGSTFSTMTAQYDALSRLSKVIGAANQTTTYGYDAQNNLTSVQDANGNPPTTASYDALNRLAGTVDALGHSTGVTYDPQDNPVAMTDANGNTITEQYDGFDEVSQRVSPDTGTTTFARDLAGNVVSSTDARGITTTMTYDALDRLTQRTFGSGGTSSTPETQTFTYDSCTHGVGQLCQVTDASGSTSWTYDLWGRVAQRTQVVNLPGGSTHTFTVGYTYDNAGRLVSETYPSGMAVQRTYLASRPVSIAMTSPSWSGSQTLLSGVGYAPDDTLLGWTWAVDGSTFTLDHTLDGWVSAVHSTVNGVVSTRNYAYDNNGNITSLTDPNDGTAGVFFGYDALDRLTSGLSAAVSASYGYDPNDNRLTSTLTSVTTPFSIDPSSNRITLVSGRSVTTDAAGNITSDSTNTYSFDAKGRMASSVNAAGLTTAYAYDALGERVQKSNLNGTWNYVRDDAGRLLGIYDASGAPIEELVYLNSRPVADVRGATTYRILSDRQGTPRQLLDASDAPVWTWDSDDGFGALAPTGSLTFDLRFPGQIADVETGLVNNGFRDYAPAWGRYVESDPIGLTGGNNTYGYADGNPLGNTDAPGLHPEGVELDEEVCSPLNGCHERHHFTDAETPEEVEQETQEEIQKVIPRVPVAALPSIRTYGDVENQCRMVADKATQMQSAVAEKSRGFVTMGAAIVKDKNGNVSMVVSTNEKYFRNTVKQILSNDDVMATVPSGVGHAEQKIISWAASNGYTVEVIGAGRPICPACAAAIAGTNAIPATPFKKVK